jgi:hypothetical protein
VRRDSNSASSSNKEEIAESWVGVSVGAAGETGVSAGREGELESDSASSLDREEIAGSGATTSFSAMAWGVLAKLESGVLSNSTGVICGSGCVIEMAPRKIRDMCVTFDVSSVNGWLKDWAFVNMEDIIVT